jgi:hypothetical protein
VTIPPIERPAQLEQLWEEGEPLTADTLPSWLELADAGYYRRVALEPAGDAERTQLEELGLIVDETGVYIEDPTSEQIFEIATASGSSPLELRPSPEPCLTRDDVSDVTASYVADPFMLRLDRWYLFCEVWDWRADKGVIGLAVSADGLAWSYEQVVVAEDFHLSYPYVFGWEGETYLVPESFQAKAVRLYRATRFPYEWECVAELLQGERLVDPSPFCVHGRWWMFAGTGQHDELRLFGAPGPAGPWTEHPASPVVTADPVRGRPAGRVVLYDDRLLRFAQRCDSGYGLDVRALEIVELTSDHYRERELQPPVLAGSGSGWNGRGMHHVDAHLVAPGQWFAAVDGWHAPGDP